MGRYSFADRAARKEPMTQEEALKTINEAQNLPLQALFSVLWVWGPRINEAIRLEKRDITILTHEIKVRMPLSKKRKHHRKTIFEKYGIRYTDNQIHIDTDTHTKTNTEAYHFLKANLETPGLAPLLEYLKQAPDGKLFRFSIRTAQRKLHQANPNTSTHWFRHTRATRLAERTDDILAMVDWFGWADARPAFIYVQMTGKQAARLADKVD